MEHPQISVLRWCPGHILISKLRSRVEHPHIWIPETSSRVERPHILLLKSWSCGASSHLDSREEALAWSLLASRLFQERALAWSVPTFCFKRALAWSVLTLCLLEDPLSGANVRKSRKPEPTLGNKSSAHAHALPCLRTPCPFRSSFLLHSKRLRWDKGLWCSRFGLSATSFCKFLQVLVPLPGAFPRRMWCNWRRLPILTLGSGG